MKKVLNLELPGVRELNKDLLEGVNGGGFGIALRTLGRKVTPIAVSLWVMDNWDSIKSGFADGWNENH